MKLTFFITCVFYGFLTNFAQAQQPPSPPPPTSTSKNKLPAKVEEIPYIFVLQIDIYSNVTLSVQKTEGSKNLGDIVDSDILTEFFALLNNQESKNSSKQKSKINPSFIVKVDPNLDFGTTVNFLKKVRKFGGDSVKLETSKKFYDPFVFIPKEPENNPKAVLKPNPLTLIVEITADKKVTLNREDQGTLDDLSNLKKLLAKIFQERMDNGVFREGTNEVEKTIYVKASPVLWLSDVVKVVDALKEVGTSPVGLQIDDLQ